MNDKWKFIKRSNNHNYSLVRWVSKLGSNLFGVVHKLIKDKRKLEAFRVKSLVNFRNRIEYPKLSQTKSLKELEKIETFALHREKDG